MVQNPAGAKTHTPTDSLLEQIRDALRIPAIIVEAPAGPPGPPGADGSPGGATIDPTTNLIQGDGAGNGSDSGIAVASVVVANPLTPTPTTLNEVIAILQAYGLCALLALFISFSAIAPARATNFGDVPASTNVSTLWAPPFTPVSPLSIVSGNLSIDLTGYVPTTRTINTHALSSNISLSSSDIGLGNVTNDAQTKLSIVPNTPPAAGQLLVGNVGGTAYAPKTISGSGATISLADTGVITISAIPNASLQNSSISIAGAPTALGGSISQDTITGLSATGIVVRTSPNTLGVISDNSSNWDSAFTERRQWDGGSTNLIAATGRTSLGATTVGSNIFTLTNPGAITFLRVNADNTVSALDDASFRTAIGAGTGSGDALTSNPLSQFASTTSSQFKGVISDENAPDGASSKVIMAVGSLSVASGKTGTFSNTLTFVGTDGSTLDIGAGGTLGPNAFTSTAYVPVTRSLTIGPTTSDLSADRTFLGNVTNDAQIKSSDFPSSSVDSEIALFSGTGGKTLKRASTTGVLKASSGVIAPATAKTDYWDTTDFIASGASHTHGLVPDPGSTSGTTRFLREDATFSALIDGGNGNYTTHGDSAYTILSTDRFVVTSANLTASRTWTLPAANGVAAGTRITIIDQNHVNGANVLLVRPAGTDIFYPTGSTTYTVSGGCAVSCISDGVSSWYTTPFGYGSPSSFNFIQANGSSNAFSATSWGLPGTAPVSGQIIRANGTTTTTWSGSTYPSSASTAGKVMQSDGSNFVNSTPTWPTTSGASGKVVKSDGTNLVMSTETYATPGTSGNLMVSDGTNWTSAAAPVERFNASTAAQTSIGTGETYVTRSSLVVPAGAFAVGGQYHARLIVAKTAGTGTFTIQIKVGTAGTTSDTTAVTLTTTAGTSATDTAQFDIGANFQSVGSGTSAVMIADVTRNHALTTTGFGTTSGTSFMYFGPTTGSGFASNAATTIGISITGSTAFAGTIQSVQAYYGQ